MPNLVLHNRLRLLLAVVSVISFNLAINSVSAQDGPNYTNGSAKESGNVCDKCNKPILGRYIKADGFRFHPSCFVCSRCGKPITGAYQRKGSDFYHPDCYKKEMGLVCTRCGKLLGNKWQVLGDRKFHAACLKKHLQETSLICDICGKPITGKYTKDKSRNYHIECFRNFKLHSCVVCNTPIEGKMLVDPWGNRAHARHGKNATRTCSSCSRIISGSSSKGGYVYDDGRTICGICKQTVVETNSDVMRSRNTVLAALHTIGITNIPANIPINVVDLKRLKKFSTSSHPSNSKGFTVCETMYRNDQPVSRKQTIYILNGLPLLEFNGVLAHEIMHVWLNENGIELTDAETEGFCNLGAMQIYRKDGSKFGQVLLENLEKDTDPIYGDGYRKIKKRVETIGWGKLLRQLQAKSN